MKHPKRNLLSVLAMLVCCICLGLAGKTLNASAAASYETLAYNTWERSSLTTSIDTRYYTINVPKPGYVTVYCNSFFYSCSVWLLTDDMQGTALYGGWLGGSETSPKTWSEGVWLEKGTYLIKVATANGRLGDFWLKATYRAAGNNETEPNNTYARATKLSLNQKRRGLLSWSDSDDYYTFTLSKGRKLTLQLTSYLNAAGFEVRNTDMEVIGQAGWINGTEEAPNTKNMDLDLTAGKYYIHVYSNSGNKGYYDLIVKPVKVLAEGIVLNREKATIYKGNKLQLKSYVSPSNATNRKVTWSSSNPYVASVSSSGMITAKKPGKATITVRTTDGTKLTATCAVTVRSKTLTVSPTKLTLVRGKYRTLKVSGAPAVTTKNVKFYTTNSKIATVSSAGRIYARSVGTCKIKVVGNGLTKYVALTVKAR